MSKLCITFNEFSPRRIQAKYRVVLPFTDMIGKHQFSFLISSCLKWKLLEDVHINASYAVVATLKMSKK